MSESAPSLRVIQVDHAGLSYSGSYEIIGGLVIVYSAFGTRTAPSVVNDHALAELLLARIIKESLSRRAAPDG